MCLFYRLRHCEEQATWRYPHLRATKKPHEMRSGHKKHKNIEMSGGHLCAVTYVNILAFFYVVASSQICPHLFEGQR